MSVRVSDILAFLEGAAPGALSEDWDNTGLLCGDENACVTGAVFSLDITGEVLDEAKNRGANLIISHHPLIFTPLSAVTAEGPGGLVYRLAANGISAICMHTNLDAALGGVNDTLAAALSLKDVTGFSAVDLAGCAGLRTPQYRGRVGSLDMALTAQRLAAFVCQRLGCFAVRASEGGGCIQRVAVMGGAGAPYLFEAAAAGAEAFVTADVKHHEFLSAKERGLVIIDAGHFHTENVVIPPLCDLVKKEFPSIPCAVSEKNTPPYTVSYP